MTHTEELIGLLKEALERMGEVEANDERARPELDLDCANCVAGVPVAHSFGCRVREVVRQAGVEVEIVPVCESLPYVVEA